MTYQDYFHELFAASSVLLSCFLCGYYLVMVQNNDVKPHFLSWLIWSTAGLISFSSQWWLGAGIGAWATGLNACLMMIISYCCWKKQWHHVSKP